MFRTAHLQEQSCDRELGKHSLRSIAVSSTRTNRQEFAYLRTSYPWSSVAVDHIQGSVTAFTFTHLAAQRKRAHGKQPPGRLITTARLLFFETTFFACCKVRKRNRFMAVKTENSAILLFRFNYHFFTFLLSCLGKMNGKQMDGNRRMTHSMLGRADGDLNRPDSLVLRFCSYKLRMTQTITQISTIVPISPYPNIVASPRTRSSNSEYRSAILHH
jgi:hypothetical protein